MHYLTCTAISSVDLAQYEISLLTNGYLWNVIQIVMVQNVLSSKAQGDISIEINKILSETETRKSQTSFQITVDPRYLDFAYLE